MDYLINVNLRQLTLAAEMKPECKVNTFIYSLEYIASCYKHLFVSYDEEPDYVYLAIDLTRIRTKMLFNLVHATNDFVKELKDNVQYINSIVDLTEDAEIEDSIKMRSSTNAIKIIYKKKHYSHTPAFIIVPLVYSKDYIEKVNRILKEVFDIVGEGTFKLSKQNEEIKVIKIE